MPVYELCIVLFFDGYKMKIFLKKKNVCMLENFTMQKYFCVTSSLPRKHIRRRCEVIFSFSLFDLFFWQVAHGENGIVLVDEVFDMRCEM